MTFHGTLAQLNDLLNTNAGSTISYIDNTDTPAASATLTLAIHDNGNTGGGDLSANDTATINITAVNDAPVATITPASYSATENITLNLKTNGLSVSDVDGGPPGTETVTLSVTEGTLHVLAGTSGAGVSGDGTNSVTITGTIAQINALLQTDGTSVVQYTNTNDNPSATATLTLLIHDNGNSPSGDLSASDTATINITAQNDAPVATITPTEYDGSPNVAISLKNNGLSVSDVDGNAGSETVTLSVTSGTLTVTAGGSGAGVAGSGTNSVTITGTITQINALLTTDSTSTVSYVDTTGGTKTLTLLIHDNGNTGGGDLSASDTASIVLDQPPVVANAGNTVAYTEQQASPSAVVVDSAITVTDPDSLTLHSATVKITGGVFAGDILNADTTGTAITAVWNGTDTLTLTGVDTPIDYQHVLQSVTFSSSSDDPTNGGANTARTITWTVNDDFDVASTPVTTTINVTAVNDGPAAVITPTSYSATEQTALNLKNTGLSVSDADANVNQVSVTLSVTEGTLSVTAGTSGVTSVSGSGTNSVTIQGSIAQINALLATDGTSTVSYIDNTDNPSASATLTLLIDDGGATGGGSLTANDTATINITAVNDAPVATITPASYNATENITLNLKTNGLSVSDVDGNSGSETVTLSVTEGTLHVLAGTSGAGVSGDNTSSVTITGTIAQINALLQTDGTSVVQYTDNNDAPAATATLTLAIHDNGNSPSGDLSASDTATINITAVNDGPAAAITPTSYSATEQTTLVLKNTGLAVSDVDGGSGSETVTLSVGEGVLNVTAGGSGAGVAGNGTSSVTITGTIAQINALLTTDGTSTVSYIDNSDMPAASTTLTLLIHDNGNTGGGDLTASDTATINITAVNDAPVFTSLDNNPTFVENGPPIVLDNNATLVDPDLAGLGNYAGSTLTLAKLNPTPLSPTFDDTFGGSGTLAFDVTNVRIGATVVGTYTQQDGVLAITFNSNATQANVNAVLDQITYSNANDTPPASVDIGYTFSDNNDGTQGTGGVLSTTGHIVVNITPTNDPPLLFNVASNAGYQPGTSGSAISPALVVSDPDGPGVNDIAGATVKIASGFLAGDQLFADVGSTGITASYNAGTHILTLSGVASENAYQSVLDTVVYSSTAADPTAAGADPNRTIEWQATDVLGAASTVQTTNINFVSGPTVDLDGSAPGSNYTTTYTENGAPLSVSDTDIVVQDTNSPLLNFAFITLTNAQDHDILSFSGLPAGITGSVDTSTPGQITVALHGAASPADYQTAIHNVGFSNSSDDPSTVDRNIDVFAGDNDLNSNTAHATIHVTAVNDAPVNTLPAQFYASANQNSALVGLSVADPDAESGAMSTTLSVVQGTLTLSSSGGASVSGSGTNTVVLTGTLTQINTSLSASGNVVYHAPDALVTDTFTMTTDDGGHTGVGGPLTDTDHVDIFVGLARGQTLDHFIV